MMSNDEKIALLERHKRNRALVACLEYKVDTMREHLEAVVADLRRDRLSITDVQDGSLHTVGNVIVAPTLVSDLSHAITELRQAMLDEAATQGQVNRLGLV